LHWPAEIISVFKLYLSYFRIISRLQVHPALGVATEIAGQPNSGASRNGTLPGTDFVDAALRDRDRHGEIPGLAINSFVNLFTVAISILKPK